MNQNERKTVMRRMVLLIAVAALVMGLYALRLIFLQLVNSDEYKSRATNTTDYNFTVTAARGDIVDSTGKRIATTTTSYNVVLNKLQMGDEDLDSLLQRVVELFEKNGESWTDTLLISQPDAAGNYTFTARDDSSSDQRQLTTMKENLGLQQYATANDVMEMLVEKNNLQDLPLRWQRTLAGIHYEMELQAFSNVNNFVMAENVSQVTVATIKEHSLTLTNAGEITIDLDLNVFPSSDDLPVTWSSSNEKILTVDDRGIVTVVGASPNITVHAVIIAECGGLQDYVTIYVPAYQAAYLTQNLYDPETYEQDNLEWDSIIYAKPSAKPG